MRRLFTQPGRTGVCVPVFLLLSASLLLAGCKKSELASKWRDGLVVVDGENHEWDGAITYFDDENAAIGVINDERYLYISLLTTSQTLQQQIMRSGFTLWFDPEGGKKKTLGIRFPLGMNPGGMEGGGPGPGGLEFGGRGGFAPQNFDSLQQVFMEAQTALEILGPGEDDVRRVLLAEAPDLFVTAGVSSRGLVYELRIPLATSDTQPYAIGTTAGAVVGLGMETPEMDMSAMRERRSGPPGGGGMPGGGGGMPGGGMPGGGMRGGPGGGAGGERPKMPEPLKVWTKITLAAAGSEQQHQETAGK